MASSSVMEECSSKCVFRQLPSGLLVDLLPPEVTTEHFTGNDEKDAARKLYESLPVTSWQTRLLQIKSSTDKDSPIICRLFIANVIHYEGLGIHDEDGPHEVRYEALSYEWGNPRLCHSITVNGVQYPVRDNLFRALRQLRTDRDRYLWVDALCINQSDNDEKSTQVRRMLAIYQKASKVVIWNPYWNDGKTEALSRLLTVEYEDIKKTHSAECSENMRVVYKFLRSICRPPLFSRTWIRQEVYGARDYILQCGDYCIPSEALSSIMKTSERLMILGMTERESTEVIPTDLKFMRDPFFATRTIYDKRAGTVDASGGKYGRHTTHMKTTLLGALLSSPYFEASDPRDSVYGILGLTDVVLKGPGDKITADELSLTVDYNLTFSEVYSMVALYLIKRSKSLAILDLANWRGQESEKMNLPSWVPDWRYAPLWRRYTFGHRPQFAELMRNSFAVPMSATEEAPERTWFQSVGWTSWEATIQGLLPNGDLPTQGICLGTIQKEWAHFDLPDNPKSTKSDDVGAPGDYVTEFKKQLEDKKSSSTINEFRPVLTSDLGFQIFKSILSETKFLLKKTNEDWMSFIASTALVPQQAEKGDKICLLRGSRTSFLLRPFGDRFRLIGPASYPLWHNFCYLENKVRTGEKKNNDRFEIFSLDFPIKGDWTKLISTETLESFNLA
ncbi:heterokaryon incompatibility protein-domain-containing protein [Nemania sp. FL0031]|nr:heterokaryon incompatibility protein-domain-containing protein [Nemania sp. FL0031]